MPMATSSSLFDVTLEQESLGAAPIHRQTSVSRTVDSGGDAAAAGAIGWLAIPVELASNHVLYYRFR